MSALKVVISAALVPRCSVAWFGFTIFVITADPSGMRWFPSARPAPAALFGFDARNPGFIFDDTPQSSGGSVAVGAGAEQIGSRIARVVLPRNRLPAPPTPTQLARSRRPAWLHMQPTGHARTHSAAAQTSPAQLVDSVASCDKSELPHPAQAALNQQQETSAAFAGSCLKLSSNCSTRFLLSSDCGIKLLSGGARRGICINDRPLEPSKRLNRAVRVAPLPMQARRRAPGVAVAQAFQLRFGRAHCILKRSYFGSFRYGATSQRLPLARMQRRRS